MSHLTAERVSAAVCDAGLLPIEEETAAKLAQYGNLLTRWNRQTNLTSILSDEGVLHRHLIESVAAAQYLPTGVSTLLDYGSGAGLPGIPIAICCPEVMVTLAEAQGKKVAFLREVLRSLNLICRVFPNRVVNLDKSLRFDVVTMRAVDRMAVAIPDAISRVREGGWLALFLTEASESRLAESIGFEPLRRHGLPETGNFVLYHPA